MDKSAIEKIQDSTELAIASDELSKLQIDNVLVTPGDLTVKDLQAFMPTARRFEQRFKTNSLADFRDYVNSYDSLEGLLTVSGKTTVAKFIVDNGSPEIPLHRDHTAELTLDITPCFNALREHNGVALDQTTASEFLEDWKPEISNILDVDGKKISVGQAASRLRNITIEQAREIKSEVSDFGYKASALEDVEAKSDASMPAFITFTTPCYNGLPAFDLTMRVSVLTGGDRPTIKYRLVAAEKLTDQISAAFKHAVTDGLVLDCPIYIGSV